MTPLADNPPPALMLPTTPTPPSTCTAPVPELVDGEVSRTNKLVLLVSTTSYTPAGSRVKLPDVVVTVVALILPLTVKVLNVAVLP